MEEINNISINNVAFPIILLPFISRASYISGKKILFKIDERDFLLNFNQSVYVRRGAFKKYVRDE